MLLFSFDAANNDAFLTQQRVEEQVCWVECVLICGVLEYKAAFDFITLRNLFLGELIKYFPAFTDFWNLTPRWTRSPATISGTIIVIHIPVRVTVTVFKKAVKIVMPVGLGNLKL